MPKSTRTNLTITTPMDMIQTLADNNIGALTLLIRLASTNPDPLDNVLLFLNLDDLNMRGEQVWVAFKYACDEDDKRFIEVVHSKDEAMIAKVNELCPRHPGEAVFAGASYKRR